jgi:hypothetical protein
LPPEKKILILIVDAGLGYRSAALAIAAAIPDNCGPSYTCQIINFLLKENSTSAAREFPTAAMGQVITGLYRLM